MTTQAIEPTIPRYGEASLDALATSVLASLGAPDEPNPLGLERAERVCLLVIDALGWELLRAQPAAAPFMSEIAMTSAPLTVGFPATTATSLASLGTGRPPGQHGMLGYQVRIPGSSKLLNALRWDRGVDPVRWQPGSTIFERASQAGIRSFRIAPGQFDGTGLSTAAMRGAEYLPAGTFGALVSQAAAALSAEVSSPPVLAEVYYGGLDATGHMLGCTSDAWRYELAHVDRLAEQLASALPRGTVLHITGDHGMVDVIDGERVDVDQIPELRAGVTLLGGEPRARHLYCQPGATDDVIATWNGLLAERAWVLGRDQAIAAGWFGPVDDAYLARIGDVIVAPSGPTAIIASKAEPGESKLEGLHGSLTRSDQLVPLLTVTIG